MAIAEYVEKGNANMAAIATGGLRAVESLFGYLHPPRKVEPGEEEPFRDPAAIYRRKK